MRGGVSKVEEAGRRFEVEECEVGICEGFSDKGTPTYMFESTRRGY